MPNLNCNEKKKKTRTFIFFNNKTNLNTKSLLLSPSSASWTTYDLAVPFHLWVFAVMINTTREYFKVFYFSLYKFRFNALSKFDQYRRKQHTFHTIWPFYYLLVLNM